jgi:hypothetical protein
MRRLFETVLIAAALVASAACDEPARVGPPPTPTGPVTPQPAQPGQPGPEADAGTGRMLDYRDEHFVEAETNRDPFRSFADMFERRPAESAQRTVKMPTTGIDQMRLIAIVSGVARPRAMLVDQVGVGHVVERGDYIGRPEVVQAGGSESMPVTLNWRVDRIRPNEVVLSREDPTSPDRPSLTRVIPLHEEEDEPLR